jgi:hypothetical protein
MTEGSRSEQIMTDSGLEGPTQHWKKVEARSALNGVSEAASSIMPLSSTAGRSTSATLKERSPLGRSPILKIINVFLNWVCLEWREGGGLQHHAPVLHGRPLHLCHAEGEVAPGPLTNLKNNKCVFKLGLP